MDPDEYIKAHGAESFTDMMKKAQTSIEYLMAEIMEKCDMASEEGRAEFAQKATAVVEKYAFDSIEAEMYLKRIHTASGFSMEALYSNIDKIPEQTLKNDSVAYGIKNKFESATERAVVAVIMEHPELTDYAKDKLREEYFTNAAYQKIFQYLCQNQKKTSPMELLRIFEGDEPCCTAISAVAIENNVFGDASAFLKDCCLKMRMDSLHLKRSTLKARLEEPAGEPEKKIALAGEIAALDAEIKKLRSEF